MEKVGLKGMALGRHKQNKGRDAGAQAVFGCLSKQMRLTARNKRSPPGQEAEEPEQLVNAVIKWHYG